MRVGLNHETRTILPSLKIEEAGFFLLSDTKCMNMCSFIIHFKKEKEIVCVERFMVLVER